MGILVLVLAIQKHLNTNKSCTLTSYMIHLRVCLGQCFFCCSFLALWHNVTMPCPIDQDITLTSPRSQTFGDLQGLLTRSAKLSFSCTGKPGPRQQCPDCRPALYADVGVPSPLLSFSCCWQGQTFFQKHLLWSLVWK